MSRRKLRKSKQKRKNKKEDTSKIISCVEDECVGAKGEEFSSQPCVCAREPRKQKCAKSTAKQVHFCVLPDKYEPLEEDTASDTATEQTHRGQQHKHTSFRKVCARLLRFGHVTVLFKLFFPAACKSVWC